MQRVEIQMYGEFYRGGDYHHGLEKPRYPVPAPIIEVQWHVFPTQVAFWLMDEGYPVFGYVRPKEGEGGIYYHYTPKPVNKHWL